MEPWPHSRATAPPFRPHTRDASHANDHCVPGTQHRSGIIPGPRPAQRARAAIGRYRRRRRGGADDAQQPAAARADARGALARRHVVPDQLALQDRGGAIHPRRQRRARAGHRRRPARGFARLDAGHDHDLHPRRRVRPCGRGRELGTQPRRSHAAGRAGACAPRRDVVHLGHDRPAQGHRARRRHSRKSGQQPGGAAPGAGFQAWHAGAGQRADVPQRAQHLLRRRWKAPNFSSNRASTPNTRCA